MSDIRKRSLQERLDSGDTILCAEGYVFELERRGYVSAGAYVPTVVLDQPDVVRQLHEEFLRAGSDVLVALTYYGHREKLKVVGRENDLEALNRKAVQLAREVASDNDVLVAGNICNTWTFNPDDSEASAEVRRQYTEQIGWAKEEGVDFILAETLEYLGEAEIALEVIQSFGLPAVVNFSAIYEKTKDGFTWKEACERIAAKGANIVGFNCARGPKTILPLAAHALADITTPLSLVPVPYSTDADCPAFQFLKRENGDSAYTLGLDAHAIDRMSCAEFALQARDQGVQFIGLCCGAGPHQIRAVAEALGRNTAASQYAPDFTKHGLLGDDTVVSAHEKEFSKQWK